MDTTHMKTPALLLGLFLAGTAAAARIYDDAAPGGVGFFNQRLAVPLHGHGRTEPEARRLRHHAPGVRHSSAHVNKAVAGLRDVFAHTPPPSGGSKPHQPAQRRAQRVQQAQRTVGEQAIKRQHGWRGERAARYHARLSVAELLDYLQGDAKQDC